MMVSKTLRRKPEQLYKPIEDNEIMIKNLCSTEIHTYGIHTVARKMIRLTYIFDTKMDQHSKGKKDKRLNSFVNIDIKNFKY